MNEREPVTAEQLMLNPKYAELVRTAYQSVRTSSKEGHKTREGRFFPRQVDSPTYSIDFDAETGFALFNIGNFGGFTESSMTYHIREGEAVFKTGYAEGHSQSNWGLTHFTDETKEEMEQDGEPLSDDEFIIAPPLVELAELEDVARLIDDCYGNAVLVHRLPQFTLLG